MKLEKRYAKKSLRTIVMMWLLMFSVIPLAFITGYSLVKYEQAINQELYQRLVANHREVKIIFDEFEKEMRAKNQAHARDKSLVYFLSSNSIGQARDLAMRWMSTHIIHQMSIFNREKRMEISLFRDPENQIKRHQNLEGSVVYLEESFLSAARASDQMIVSEFTKDRSLDLAVFAPIRAANDSVVGYIDEVFKVNSSFLESLRARLGVEIAFISKDGTKIVSSQPDLESYRPGFFSEKLNSNESGLFELTMREEPYGFMVQKIDWGTDLIYVAVGASKKSAMAVLKNVNIAFFTVVGAVALFLAILSFFISRTLLRPVNDLVEAIQNVDFDSANPVAVKETSDTELGILTATFNDMFSRIHSSQKELKENIKKLEAANMEVREAQAKLVHAAKMAGLGQLVAGVAHELNNPISFIYSNMAHLKDYGDRLIQLLKTAEKDPQKLDSEKERLEYDYMVKDLPKLIKSCEDGAKRTRDIVTGLRNFSRLDEAKLKEVDIHEGIESTLDLLSSEFKSRINIVKNYSDLPKILCYPSQLNQVFMNILSNAIQAIPEQGEITITTSRKGPNEITVSFRDTGIGMSPETVQKIFDPFFTTKDVNKGTGLGMSIAFGVIQKHGGEIDVRSTPKKGSEFIITLPIRAIEK